MVSSEITNLGELTSVYSVAFSEISSADLIGGSPFWHIWEL
jgi:hypothetical protein